MKRKIAIFVLIAMVTSIFVIPQALAVTSDGLLYRPNNGDRFYYEFNLMDYGVVYAENEIFYVEIDDASTPIPDPLSHLYELSSLGMSFYFENDTDFSSYAMAFMFLPHFQYPVGNWSLITDLATADLELMLPFEVTTFAINQDSDYWGYSWSNITDDIELSVTADYSKFDGMLSYYNFEAWNTTSQSIISHWSASRFSYHGLRWGFEEGDRFNFHLITTGNDLGVEYLEEDMVLEVAEDGMAVIPYDCSNFGDIPYFGASLEWMNGSSVAINYFMYAMKIAVPLGNWTLLDSFIEDLSVSYDEMVVDPADIYFWGYSWEMTMSELLYETHTDYLKIDGMVAHHTVTITNTTSSEELGTISIERFDLEMYTDRTPPAVNSPDDVEFVEGTTGNNITWILSDENPTTYQVLVNGTVEASGSWTNGTEIVLDLDDFEVGVYNCTIVVYDIAGNMVMDTVIVTVTTPGGGIVNLLMDNILYIAIGVGAVVIIGAVVCMRRKS